MYDHKSRLRNRLAAERRRKAISRTLRTLRSIATPASVSLQKLQQMYSETNVPLPHHQQLRRPRQSTCVHVGDDGEQFLFSSLRRYHLLDVRRGPETRKTIKLLQLN